MTRFRAALVVVVLTISASVEPARNVPNDFKLSPASWPAGDLERYTKLARTIDRPHPLAEGSKGMVSGASNALAVRSGLEALKQGGSAADAVIAHALAQIALTVGAPTSYAGFATMM